MSLNLTTINNMSLNLTTIMINLVDVVKSALKVKHVETHVLVEAILATNDHDVRVIDNYMARE